MRKVILALFALATLTGWAKGKTVVWEQPSTEVNTKIDGLSDALLQIVLVEFAEDETRLTMHIASRPTSWVKLSSGTHLIAEGKQYALKRLDGMELDKETYLTEQGQTDVVLHFEPLPMNTKRFDFTEGEDKGAWKLLGVEDAKTRAGQLFPSNWRNTQTGDWDISFYDECAVYDCQFWNYSQKIRKGDKYLIVLENNGKEITVNVGKNKKGLRRITIDGKEGQYSLITSITLPDYPQKDTRAGFKDTGYRTDTVTFVGWLRNMPEELKEDNGEFRVEYTNIFTDKNIISYSKTDSLGRFTIKVPLHNSSEVDCYEEPYIRTLFEPGETYFMLYDYKGGHTLFMGRDCRLQNEMLTYPIPLIYSQRPQKDMDEATLMQLLESLKKDKANAMQRLEQVMAKHPNISDRYIKCIADKFNASVGSALMQIRYWTENRMIPAGYLDYAYQESWQKMAEPYTLYSDAYWFRKDYIRYLTENRYAIPMKGGYCMLYEDVYAPLLRNFRDAGKVQITDGDLSTIEKYAEINHRVHKEQADNEVIHLDLTEEESKWFNKACEILDREDIKKALKDNKSLFDTYRAISILDSIGCSQDMRDIIIAGKIYDIFEYNCMPLGDNEMQFIEENIKLPAVRDLLYAEQEKYLALQRGDGAGISSLKSAEDVANMSDGEKILRKITEPYRGKIILMDIWGTWCGPCKEALSHSQEEYRQLKDYDLVYLYLANRSEETAWKNIIQMYNVTGENVVHYNLPKAQQSAIEHFVGVSGYPTYKLIDRNGNVLDVDVDARNLEGLKKLLNQMK